MFDYETLDAIADAYNPTLAILTLAWLIKALISKQYRYFSLQTITLIFGLSIAYALMYLDNHFQLWPIFKLDYSTHTAVAFIFVSFLTLAIKKFPYIWPSSLLAYILLMLYQQYHSLLDIITTALIIAIIFLPILIFLDKKSKNQQQP